MRYRPIASADTDAVHRHWNHLEVRRYLWDDRAVARDTVLELLAASDASFARAGYGLWVLDDEDGFAGTCGIRPVEGTEDVEILYSIDPERWGRGLATEAARAVLSFVFARFGFTRVLGGVDAPNAASRRVLEKCGMSDAADLRAGPDGVCYLAVLRARFSSTLA